MIITGFRGTASLLQVVVENESIALRLLTMIDVRHHAETCLAFARCGGLRGQRLEVRRQVWLLRVLVLRECEIRVIAYGKPSSLQDAGKMLVKG